MLTIRRCINSARTLLIICSLATLLFVGCAKSQYAAADSTLNAISSTGASDIIHKSSQPSVYSLVIISTIIIFGILNSKSLSVALTFAYNCFFKPLGQHNSQQDRLNAFYTGQASVYDATRGGLLRGRKTMLKLCAAELKRQDAKLPIWVDIGGGTGWNIEQMDEYFGVARFERIYLVDLCQPLCEVAERRFKAKGWDNVTVVCQDATSFVLPGLERSGAMGQVDLVTMSYSLSMMDAYHSVVDRIEKLLRPQAGFVGVADFYVSGAIPGQRTSAAGVLGYQCNWFTRVFWQHWFEFDHVHLHPCRRNYLEHKLHTHKVFNGRNHFVVPYLVQIPYYVWLGRSRDLSNRLPKSTDQSVQSMFDEITPESSTIALPDVEDASGPEEQRGWRRLPYQPTKPEHAQFSTYIYGFTWEDPRRDLEVLDLSSNDRVLAITSAGDNALAYAAHQSGAQIHCVDMNPCQNHLLELKLAALRNLGYEQFWRMFGLGREPDFRNILDSVLSADMSSAAYQYWRNNVSAFAPTQPALARAVLGDMAHCNLYTTGYSGMALHSLRAALKLLGVHRVTQKLIASRSIDEQAKLWKQKIRHRIFSNLVVRLLDNPVAMWQFMGVPINQWNMLRSEGSMSQYVRDTLDPVAAATSFTTDNYFYRLLFARQYSPTCCPDYLTKSGFERLQSTAKSGCLTFQLHTATIIDVLAGMRDGELTKAVIMDHMDWFSAEDADAEVGALARVIAKGGFVLWRSAARVPWYIKTFEANGFAVEALSIRQPNIIVPIDRVNMYASFYKATRV
ncbi:hypothetical protein BX661DRAFT_165659 [Kickxella alabastrina]|uniref:uncharacterized protein n=1 Tax=Kickxella alabastrina TaxID=61397 RepID=UPI00221E4E44|nr:uncharacterized protein BX661DRAFT_165659 [Kickxella alabastrina]KAI7821634.1 hypothetical protein BX661DRAFT_165659 [Kickxella alabastrina]